MTRTVSRFVQRLLRFVSMKFYIYDLYFLDPLEAEAKGHVAKILLYAQTQHEAAYIIETELIAAGGTLIDDSNVMYIIESINAPDLGVNLRLPQNTIEVRTEDGSVYRKDFRRVKLTDIE